MLNVPALLSPEHVSEMLKAPTSRLDRWRSRGVGPDYVKVEGRVFYPAESVFAYIDRSTVQPVRRNRVGVTV